ncbi:Hypothetical protein R9X50_00411700 [Acrodontium crateriforme]|uniref:Uncharacterized protein n=1 Tax=Acrodontium crateriforme TaxID=150365 RepID=A0AAQ3M467_9PEZI|nr:Hypothetical protein R9X50_00411700 [Acrodontium crateriforme]
MGNNHSSTAIIKCKLSNALPDYQHSSWCDDKKARPYISEQDREQFIYGVAIVISNNGEFDLRDHNFALLYSRRENDRLVARIVAEKNGVVTAKIDGEGDGKDHNEAFKVLRKHVETKLDKLLEEVPPPTAATVTGSKAPSSPPPPVRSSTGSANQVREPPAGGIPVDAPPAYGTGDVKSRKM